MLKKQLKVRQQNEVSNMKKFLLIFLCFLFMSCSSVVKNNTLIGTQIKTEIETLPVTADLAVSEQKARGEATGPVTDINDLAKEALAKALGQDPPSVGNYDVLVGQNAFTEVDGTNIKVILTGYPAYYTNFRTATKEDSLRLNMVDADRREVKHENESEPASKPASKSEWYFSLKYHFGDGYGWGTGIGKRWQNVFFGVEGDQGGFIEDEKTKGIGGGLTLGGVYDALPYQLKLVFGSSAGFWFTETEYWYNSYKRKTYLLTPFVKLRWHGLETGFRMFTGLGLTDDSDTDLYFTIGFTF
jgi:hypothetical protein